MLANGPAFNKYPSIYAFPRKRHTYFIANDGNVLGGSFASRRWIFNGMVVGTSPTLSLPSNSEGRLILEATATGNGLTVVVQSTAMALIPFQIIEDGPPPAPTAPNAFAPTDWTFAPSGTSGELAVGIISTPAGTTNIKYQLDGGAWVSRGNTLSFTLTGKTDGQSYSMKLIASNTVGDSPESAAKTATPATVPSAPTLALMPGNGQVTVAWTDGATGGSAITARRLYRSTTSGFTPGPGNLIATSPTFPYVDTAVTNDTTYYYKGIAANVIGDSAASTQQAATPSAAVAQVVIARNDALSRFEITNTASFPGGIWTWYDDTGTQVSTVTTSYLLYSAVPVGKLIKGRANGNAATDSILWAVEQNNAVVDLDFTTMPDGPLNGAAVGLVANSATQIVGGKLVALDNSAGFSMNIGTIDQRFTFDALVRSTTDNDSNSTRRAIFLNRSSNESDYAALDIRGGNVILEKRVAYNYSNYASNINHSQQNGEKLVGYLYWTKTSGTPVKPYIQYYNNAVRIDSGGVGPGIDINAGGDSAPMTPNTYAAFSGPYGTGVANPSFPIAMMTSLKIEAIPDLGIRVFYHDFTVPTAGNPASITFTGTTAYTAIQAVVVSEQGYELGGITSFTGLTAGPMSLTIPNPPEGMLSPAFLRVRQTSNTANYIDYPLGTLPYYDAVDTLEAGFNVTGGASSSYSDVVQDRGLIVSWRYYNSGSGAHMYIPDSDKNAAGWPINVAIPGGYDSRAALFFEGNAPGIRNGPWNISANVTCSAPLSAFNMSGTMAASSATTNSIVLTQTVTDGPQNAWVVFPGAIPPSGGLQVSCLKQGETIDGNMVTPGIASIWGASAFPGSRRMRLMKTTGADGAKEGAGFETILSRAGTAKFASDLTQRLGDGTDIHYVWAWNDIIARKATRVTPLLEYFRDNARATSKFCGTGGNEWWNAPFYQDQAAAGAAKGFTAGFVPAITIPGGVTVTNELYTDGNPGGAVTPGSGLTLRTINPGEVFIARTDPSNYQFVLLNCISASPVLAGYTIPYGGDSKFAQLAIYGDIIKAVRRWQGEVTKQVTIEGRAILGSRFISTYECFLGDTPEDIRDYLMFNNTYQYVNEISPSFYAGQTAEYGSLAWHDKFTSDFAAFKAGMIAREVSTRTPMIAQLVNLKHNVPRLLIEAGVPRASVPRIRGPYEGGTHNMVNNVPSGDRPAFLAACQAVIRSTEYAAAMAQIWLDLKDTFGGPCVWFQDVDPCFQNDRQTQWFGLREHQFDGAWNASGVNEARYTATRAVFGT